MKTFVSPPFIKRRTRLTNKKHKESEEVTHRISNITQHNVTHFYRKMGDNANHSEGEERWKMS
jgi:peptide subunit release factor 1 (eRF1)